MQFFFQTLLKITSLKCRPLLMTHSWSRSRKLSMALRVIAGGMAATSCRIAFFNCSIVPGRRARRPGTIELLNYLFCYKTLHVSGIFSAHHQEFSSVHSALISFMQVFLMTASILALLGSGHHKNLHEIYQCRMYSRKLLMMGREGARNMYFYNRINLDN